MRRSLQGRAPGLRLERTLWGAGCEVVAGLDEVGRGSWAGPVTVAAVVADPKRRIYKVRDSKMLTPGEREALYGRIRSWARAVSVGHADVEECNALGMAQAQRLAANRAIAGLGVKIDHALIDGSWDFLSWPVDEPEPSPASESEAALTDSRAPTASEPSPVNADTASDLATSTAPVPVSGPPAPGVTTVVRGDALSLSIAAASVVAKVTRDRLMRKAALVYPAYRFGDNKGYPCPRHVAALAAWGPCAIHRRRWVFMDGLRWSGVPRLGVTAPEPRLRLFDPRAS